MALSRPPSPATRAISGPTTSWPTSSVPPSPGARWTSPPCSCLRGPAMKIAVSTDERTHLVEAVLEELARRGHEVSYWGPEAGAEADWPEVTLAAVEQVVQGAADEAVVLCWTGTGCTIAANKVPGIRAALC